MFTQCLLLKKKNLHHSNADMSKFTFAILYLIDSSLSYTGKSIHYLQILLTINKINAMCNT